MKVYTANKFPLWDAENGIYITETPVEVNTSEWLVAQLTAGVLVEVKEAKAARKAKEETATPAE